MKYRDVYETVIELDETNPGIIAGFYLIATSRSKFHFQAIGEVQTHFANFSIPLGYSTYNCEKLFREPIETILILQKLGFITCFITTKYFLPSTQQQINSVLSTCGELKLEARKVNISAEIMCLISYASNGINNEGPAGTVKSFQQFWCSILTEAQKSHDGTSIIFWSAFDYSPSFYGEIQNAKTLCSSKYHTGWWKRVNQTSNHADAFREKVDGMFYVHNSTHCVLQTF